MSKKIKIIISIAIVLVFVAILYLTVFHPRIKVCAGILLAYEEGFGDEIGVPAVPYTEYSVTNNTFTKVEFSRFSVALPSDWENQTKEGSEICVYRTAGSTQDDYGNCESIGFDPEGNDNSNLAILNVEDIKISERKKLIDGYKQLGYGMPEDFFHTIKAAYSFTKDDYSFWNYNKSLAYMYLMTFRATGFAFYSDGVNAQTYIYETDDVCGFINVQQRENSDLYHCRIEVYDANDLNTSYFFTTSVKDVQTAYAILNSIQFYN